MWKLFDLIEKYFPVVANLAIWLIHELWDTFSINLQPYLSGWIGAGIIPFIVLIGASKKHHYCLWHRVLLLNLLCHSILYTIDKVLTMLDYEFIDIFFVTLRLTQFAIVLATGMYFWNLFNLTEIWHGCITSSKKRTKAGNKGY